MLSKKTWLDSVDRILTKILIWNFFRIFRLFGATWHFRIGPAEMEIAYIDNKFLKTHQLNLNWAKWVGYLIPVKHKLHYESRRFLWRVERAESGLMRHVCYTVDRFSSYSYVKPFEQWLRFRQKTVVNVIIDSQNPAISKNKEFKFETDTLNLEEIVDEACAISKDMKELDQAMKNFNKAIEDTIARISNELMQNIQ